MEVKRNQIIEILNELLKEQSMIIEGQRKIILNQAGLIKSLNNKIMTKRFGIKDKFSVCLN